VLPSIESFPLVSIADEAVVQILANRPNRPSSVTLVRVGLLRCVSAASRCEAVEVWDASPATGAAEFAMSPAIPHRHASPRMDLLLTCETGGQRRVTQWRESSGGGDVGIARMLAAKAVQTTRLVLLLHGVMSWQTLCIQPIKTHMNLSSASNQWQFFDGPCAIIFESSSRDAGIFPDRHRPLYIPSAFIESSTHKRLIENTSADPRHLQQILAGRCRGTSHEDNYSWDTRRCITYAHEMLLWSAYTKHKRPLFSLLCHYHHFMADKV
jgi:hypothetical protein